MTPALSYINFADKIYQVLIADTTIAADTDLTVSKKLSKDALTSQNPDTPHKFMVVERMAGMGEPAIGGKVDLFTTPIRVRCYVRKMSYESSNDPLDDVQTMRYNVIKAIKSASWVGMPMPVFHDEPEPQPIELGAVGDVVFRIHQAVTYI